MYDDYMCKCFRFHFLIVDRSLALIGFCPLFMIVGTDQADSVQERVTGYYRWRQREAMDNKYVPCIIYLL